MSSDNLYRVIVLFRNGKDKTIKFPAVDDAAAVKHCEDLVNEVLAIDGGSGTVRKVILRSADRRTLHEVGGTG